MEEYIRCEKCGMRIKESMLEYHLEKNHNHLKGGKFKMDYQNELKRLQEGGNYWKPKAGQFKVKALSEIEDAEPYVKNKGQPNEESNPQFKIKLLVDGEEKLWTFGKGSTMASSQGQLVHLAVQKGKLTDVEFTIVVKSDGTKNDYTIIA